jgi:RHS repeat-associated protein
LSPDRNANVIARHDYIPFGEEILPPYGGRTSALGFGGSDNVSQRFTGQMRDQESGLDYFGARYYGSALGRFTSPDPDNTGAWLSDPQSWNMYAYGRNNPLKYVDPLGESYQICDANGKNCSKEQLTDDEFATEKQAGQANGERFSNGTLSHTDANGNTVVDGTYRQTDVDIDQSLAIGLHNAGVQSSAALNSFMKDAAMNAARGFVLAGAGIAVSELWPAAENLPLLRQVSRVLTNNSLKHLVNQGHLAEFQALDSSLTLNNVVDMGINVAETGTQIGTKTFVKIVTIGGQEVEVKAVLNSNNGLRSVYPLR